MKMKIKKGDTVEVISGKEINKGKRGEVIRVDPKKSRIVVQGVNMRKKHQRQVQTQGRTISPGIIEFEGSIVLVIDDILADSLTRITLDVDDSPDGVELVICELPEPKEQLVSTM